MRSVSIVIALGTSLWIAAPGAQAVGFGRVSTSTLLGQALNFGAVVHLDADEALARECVSAEVESGDRRLPAAAVRISVERGTDPAERVVRVTTNTPIDEPVVAVQVTLACNGTVSRRFVSFIDPPAIALPRVEVADTSVLVAQHLESQVAPVMAVTESLNGAAIPRPRSVERVPSRPDRADATERRERPARRVQPRPVVVATAEPALQAAPAARPPKPAPKPAPKAKAVVAAAPAATDTGSRLQLEAAALLAAPAASAPVPAVATVAAAASDPAASAAPPEASIADEFKRLKSLEDDVNRVRAETVATQRSMATLQARLRDAEEARYANPLVYALAVLSALLAVALAALWWRQSQSRGASPWWSPVPAPAPRSMHPDVVSLSPPVRVERVPPAVKVETAPAVMDERPIPPTVTDDVVPRRVAAPVVEALSPPTVFPPTLPPESAPRELSVEELIDLEQQAEFFIVLGQEEAAIDLLMGHLRSTGGASPLPYLKLLEIYRRRGDRDAYERIRSRFNRRFNAYAPDWDSDLQQGRSLEDHPALLANLQTQWHQPAKVLPILHSALLQRDDAAEPFDLPACRDLLLLYSVARDLAEREGLLPSIDLLLPLEDVNTSMSMPLDLDISQPLAAAPSKRR